MNVDLVTSRLNSFHRTISDARNAMFEKLDCGLAQEYLVNFLK